MSTSEVPLDLAQLNQIIAAELKIGPTDNLYRYLHPVMICGVENGQLLLSGTKTNGVVVTDRYGLEASDRKRASSLEDPGLNFTKDFHSNYKNPNRRVAVSFNMQDQDRGLHIYNDVGSEVPSVYFTLPEGSFFRVNLKEGDPLEVGIAVKIHELMKNLSIKEEPGYLNWMGSGDGVRVVSYVPDANGKEERVEVAFSRTEDSYKIESSPMNKHPKDLELLSTYRLLLEDKSFNKVVGTDGTKYEREILTSSLAQSPDLITSKK